MSYSFEINHGAGWIDLNNYILKAKIPHTAKNRDYSLRLGNGELMLKNNYPNTLAEDDKIRIKKDSTFIFCGQIADHRYNHNEKNYEIYMDRNLKLLKSKLVNQSNLSSLISATVDPLEYESSDADGRRYVSILWLLEVMFDDVGLTIDYSPVYSETVMGKSMYLFVLDEYMLYTINLPVLGTDSFTNDDYDNQRLTYFDLVSEICMSFGFNLFLTAEDTYQISLTRTTHSRTNNDYKSLIVDDEEPRYDYLSTEFYASEDFEDPSPPTIDQVRNDYYLAPEQNTVLAYNDIRPSPRYDLTWKSNFLIMSINTGSSPYTVDSAFRPAASGDNYPTRYIREALTMHIERGRMQIPLTTNNRECYEHNIVITADEEHSEVIEESLT